MREEIKLAQTVSERRVQQETLELEKDRINIAGEKMRLQKGLEREEVEAETPVRLLRVTPQGQVLKEELEVRRLENQVRELEVQRDMLLEQAKQALKLEILPLEQIPTIAGAVSQMFQGAQLSFYGEASPLFTAVVPLLDLLKNTLSSLTDKTIKE